jgi:hypothetical protein
MPSVKMVEARESTYQVAVAVGGRPEFNCILLRIGNGQMHLQSDRWVEPDRQLVARFDHITLKGSVAYCKRRSEDYLICVDVAAERTSARREPRFPVDMPGTVILIGNRGTSIMPGLITDISSSGLRLKIPSEAQVPSTVSVETAKLLVVGEVRHCRLEPDGFSAGVLLTDVFPDQAQPERRSHTTLVEKARTLRRAILGNAE